jgi:hypothetical protein
MNKSAMGLLALIVVLIVGLAPLALIWALNTLFALTIAFTFKTWLAALIVGGVVGSSGARSSK